MSHSVIFACSLDASIPGEDIACQFLAMLIKEYHIPLPMTVEEYRIAQLYMIQVSSSG